jgi:hypothetical protein
MLCALSYAPLSRGITVKLEQLLAVVAISLAGCTSSTEPSAPADGFVSTLTVTPRTAAVGAHIYAVWTVENTSPKSVTRVYNMPGAQGFILLIDATPRNTVIQQVKGEMLVVDGDSLTIAAHSKLVWHNEYVAAAAGAATITGCLPPDSTQGFDWICVSRAVSVTGS